MSSLLIVESPTKARKIKSILIKLYGNDWDTVATVGHLFDLPSDSMAVDIAGGTFEPKFVARNTRNLGAVNKAALKADEVFLGMDPDREGEAIAWHVYYRLIKKFPNKSYSRVTFHEITKGAIKESIEAPVGFSTSLVESQMGRRILDRIIGYSISPILHQQFGSRKLSAGRVQSCILNEIVNRTRTIRRFVPERYWQVTAKLDSRTLTGKRFTTKLGASKALRLLKKSKPKFRVPELKTLKPPPPFHTSSLLRFATGNLGWSTKEVMTQAQFLFERGLITYHRTESPGLSWQFIGMARKYLKGINLDVRTKARKYPSKGAHEAIRPTNPSFLPSSLNDKTSAALYRLIWVRALQTQMPDCQVERTTVLWGPEDDPILQAEFDSMVDAGWTALSAGLFDYLKPQIPDKLKLTKKKVAEGWSDPPKTYTESSLVRLMEEKKVGRPSTYSSTVQILARRGYVNSYKGFVSATLKGEIVNAFLHKCFPNLLDFSYTSEMEENLDRISDDSLLSTPLLLAHYWSLTEPQIKKAKRTDMPIKASCKCGGEYRIEIRAHNPFLKCQSCSKIHDLDVDEFSIVCFKPTVYGAPCPKCSGEVRVRQSKHGFFKQCVDCKHVVR